MVAAAGKMAESPSAGPIVGAHRLLIATALACAVIFTLYSARAFGISGAAGDALMTVVALGVAIGLGLYLRSLRTLAAKLTPHDPRLR